jgi:hypothetical protein
MYKFKIVKKVNIEKKTIYDIVPIKLGAKLA